MRALVLLSTFLLWAVAGLACERFSDGSAQGADPPVVQQGPPVAVIPLLPDVDPGVPPSGLISAERCQPSSPCDSYLRMIRALVRARFAPQTCPSESTPSVVFGVDRTGRITKPRTLEGQDDVFADDCLRAFEAASPVPPPPARLGPTLEQRELVDGMICRAEQWCT